MSAIAAHRTYSRTEASISSSDLLALNPRYVCRRSHLQRLNGPNSGFFHGLAAKRHPQFTSSSDGGGGGDEEREPGYDDDDEAADMIEDDGETLGEVVYVGGDGDRLE